MHVKDLLKTLFSEYAPNVLLDPAIRNVIAQSGSTDFAVSNIEVLNSSDLGSGIATYRVRLEFRSVNKAHMIHIDDIITVIVKGSVQLRSGETRWSIYTCNVVECSDNSVNMEETDTDPTLRIPAAP